MKTKAVIAVLGLAGAALALPAAAQMNMSAVYVGGSLGQSKFKGDCGGGGFTCDTKDTSFRAFGGYQFTRNIAAELGYTDLGKLTVSGGGVSGEVKATAFDLSGIFSWPFGDQFAVFGRLGFASTKGEASGAFGSTSDTKSGITWGLGGQFDLNKNLGFRAEYQRYKVDAGSAGSGDVDNMHLGVLWRFQ